MAANRVGNWGMINKVQSEPAETTPTTDSFDVPPWHEIHAEAEERVALFGEDSQTAWTNALARYNQKKAIVVKTNKQTAREQARKDSAPLESRLSPSLVISSLRRPMLQRPWFRGLRRRLLREGARRARPVLLNGHSISHR